MTVPVNVSKCPMGLWDCYRPIPCGYKAVGENKCEHPQAKWWARGPQVKEEAAK